MRPGTLLTALALAVGIVVVQAQPAQSQAAAPAPTPLQPGAVVRRVVMKDALSVEQFKGKLDQMRATGLFKDQLPGLDPKKPVPIEISLLTSGNYLLVVGSREWVDANIEAIRLMAYLFERPRAHLQLNLRVVQLTGPANTEVIQMTETVRALVEAQKEEVVRAFSELGDYLVTRAQMKPAVDSPLYAGIRKLFPTLGTGERPLTVPEILVLMMLDRSAPVPGFAGDEEPDDSEAALLTLSQVIAAALLDPNRDEASALRGLTDELEAWKKAVTTSKDWCNRYADQLKDRNGVNIATFREVLQRDHAIPSWIGRRLLRSLEVTERLYPSLVRKHTEQSLRELARRYTAALEREAGLEKAVARLAGAPAPKKDGKDEGERHGEEERRLATPGQALVALKSLADELVPAPLALFDRVATTADNAAPTPQQFVDMVSAYAAERAKLEAKLGQDQPRDGAPVNYARLQSLEAGLNVWLRRVSEGMARALEQQFYSRYANQLRLLANKQLGKSSNRDLLRDTAIDAVPDVARDLLLSDSGVNIFVSNSVSLQFAPDTTNTVSAQVQASLPQKLGLLERVQQANQAAGALNTLTANYGINGESIVKSLLAGGQAVPVQAGIQLSANPSIGFDASTVTLALTANQTLQPNTDKVADRVTNHSISNATITALSYEPMVLSTLASNISYYESEGGIPVLRKTPVINKLLRDIPLKPFKESKRQKGVYQSSVIILEPVVIPTIEDLIRFHGGWRDPMAMLSDEELDGPAPTAKAPVAPAAPAAPAPAAPAPSK
jgi:hypothetical protein